MKGQVLSGASAALIISRLSVKRLARGRALWLSLALVALPALAISLFADEELSEELWSNIYDILIVLMALIPPLYLAPAVGEEIEDKTFTYLWSRPFPRWSLLAGKLAGLVPIAAAILCAMVVGTFFVVFGAQASDFGRVLPAGVTAMALGTAATSALCVAIGAVIPRHATAVALMYLLVIDTSVAVMPFSIRELAIRYHVDQIATVEIIASDILWLLGMTAFWLSVAIWRITGAEYATDK